MATTLRIVEVNYDDGSSKYLVEKECKFIWIFPYWKKKLLFWILCLGVLKQSETSKHMMKQKDMSLVNIKMRFLKRKRQSQEI